MQRWPSTSRATRGRVGCDAPCLSAFLLIDAEDRSVLAVNRSVENAWLYAARASAVELRMTDGAPLSLDALDTALAGTAEVPLVGDDGLGGATTTHAVRAAIQRSQASLATLSRELGINPKTVAKWRKRATVEDKKTGPKAPHSTSLTDAEEAMVVAFRRHTLLPLDDCLYALQPTIPHLTRSALHRCLQRHGISRLPDIDGDKPKRQSFKRYPIGFGGTMIPRIIA